MTMTIKQKLLFSFILLVSVFSAVSLYLTFALKAQGEQTIYAFNQPLEAVNDSRAAAETFRMATNFADEVLAFTYPQDSSQVSQQFAEFEQNFEQQIQSAKNNKLTSDATEQTTAIMENGLDWFSKVSAHLAGSSKNNLVDLRILKRQGDDIQHQLVTLAQNTRDTARRMAEEVTADIQKQMAAVFSLLAIIAIGSIVAVFFLTSNLLKPIKGLKEAVVELSRGDGDLTRRLDVSRNDEIGQLSNEFNQFIEKVHHTVDEIAGSVNESTAHIAQFSEISEQTQKGTAQQKTEIESISSAMEQVVLSVASVNESTNQAEGQANSIYDDTQSGVELVRTSFDEMTHLNTLIDQTSHAINELSQSCNEIGSVLDVIESITEQTNLLALNAAIEAARAGEAGRGFSVVADEVRSLAMKTQESTLNIQATITQVQQQAVDAKELMDKGQAGARSCADNNHELSNALEQILASASQIRETNQLVVDHTQQQDSAITHMNESLRSIVSIADNYRTRQYSTARQ